MSGPDLPLLPVHGFVLAGGKSSRMGRDKALLQFRGHSLAASAVETLRSFCEAVSIAGNREDLQSVAPVVSEARTETGPAAGLEAGLDASTKPWALFVPVDVPLMPELLLRRWAESVLLRGVDGVRLSFLRAGGERQPTFCLLHRECAPPLTRALDGGERKLGVVFAHVSAELGPASMWVADAESFVEDAQGPAMDTAALFANVNTPEDLRAVIAMCENLPETK